MSKEIELNLSQLANGAIQQKLDGELEKIFENIHDPILSPKINAPSLLNLNSAQMKIAKSLI